MDCINRQNRLFTNVNFTWLPIKLHYFFMLGCVAGIFNFLSLMGKDLGFSATAVGISYSLIPVFSFVCKPMFGYLADYMQNTKKIVMRVLTAYVILVFCILLIEPIEKYDSSCVAIRVQCTDYNEQQDVLILNFNKTCVINSLPVNDILSCNVTYLDMSYGNHSYNITLDNQMVKRYTSRTTQDYLYLNESSGYPRDLKCFVPLDNISETKMPCNEIDAFQPLSLTCDHKTEACLAHEKEINIYYTYQFWIYTFLIVSMHTFFSIAMDLTDVSCQELLGIKRKYYGRQRLWGTASIGIFVVTAGFVNDLLNKDGAHFKYLAGYGVMTTFFILCLINSIKLNLPKANVSQNIMLDAIRSCKSMEFITYSIGTFLIGALLSLNSSYFFWYLTDLGASQTLLGMTIAVQCLVGEIPFFFFSGWFVEHLGHFSCLACSLAAFAVRFGVYSVIQNPWLVLTVEALHGVTYGVFYASLASFATVNAARGTEATTFSFLSGLNDGLGFAIGRLLGGMSFSKFGGRQTYVIVCCISLLCIPGALISHVIFRRRRYQGVATVDNDGRS